MRLVCGTLKPGSLGKLRGKRPQVKIRIIIADSMPQEGGGLPTRQRPQAERSYSLSLQELVRERPGQSFIFTTT